MDYKVLYSEKPFIQGPRQLAACLPDCFKQLEQMKSRLKASIGSTLLGGMGSTSRASDFCRLLKDPEVISCSLGLAGCSMGKSTCHTNLNTWVQPPQTHGKGEERTNSQKLLLTCMCVPWDTQHIINVLNL